MASYPDFDTLQKVAGQPLGNAWGFWGPNDELGSLNYLTPEVVRNAAKEIKTGVSIQLDMRLDAFEYRIGGREAFEHRIKDFKDNEDYNLYAHDDVLTFNTQGSSQWDGLRHVGLQQSAVYYNGLKHADVRRDSHSGKLGIQNWVERGGIVGRGILLDYHRWREETGRAPAKANSSVAITTSELEAVAQHQGTKFCVGDILIIRSGFSVWYQRAPQAERTESLQHYEFVGLERSMESVRWLWNHHFAAVAGDTVGFECNPVDFHDKDTVKLHEWLLVHWGTPIGELWDLEKLSATCAAQKSWSFFLTSAPLHVFGGVATPSNVIAVL
ncbi:uncharacterized protein AB675_1096 [Cyphellophora attinorum]|uniref:Cyclase n=1 Tax=Cyphellophora attinorum TaxID=1664694 RepID=A0A0N0NKU3_9EURO|nr:uncharacterized protein AB675_1096 [Phialophora attinorum]KPI38239.1 hypothetical protein AB675_1096 [Phialophora attinorum]